MAPNLPSELSFAQLSEVLSSHFQQRHIVIAERFQFHRGIQAADESIPEFDAAWRKLATRCEFGETLEKARGMEAAGSKTAALKTQERWSIKLRIKFLRQRKENLLPLR